MAILESILELSQSDFSRNVIRETLAIFLRIRHHVKGPMVCVLVINEVAHCKSGWTAQWHTASLIGLRSETLQVWLDCAVRHCKSDWTAQWHTASLIGLRSDTLQVWLDCAVRHCKSDWTAQWHTASLIGLCSETLQVWLDCAVARCKSDWTAQWDTASLIGLRSDVEEFISLGCVRLQTLYFARHVYRFQSFFINIAAGKAGQWPLPEQLMRRQRVSGSVTEIVPHLTLRIGSDHSHRLLEDRCCLPHR